MEIYQTAILGIVQGLTEFLPISSSAHLAIFPQLLGWQDQGLAVDAFLHLGTLLAVLIYFSKDLQEIILKKHDLLKSILLASLPVVLIGFAIKATISDPTNHTGMLIRSLPFMGSTLIIGAIILYISERYSIKKTKIKDLKITDVFIMGLAQALALMPGISRSGITISAGLLLGLKRAEAARFTFLLGVPAIAGAGFLAIKDLLANDIGGHISSTTITPLLIGLLTSFLSGLFAIDFLIKILEKHTVNAFVFYRILLGLGLLFI